MARRLGHGTRACYRRGCRRPGCIAANTAYLRGRRRKLGIPARHDYDAGRHAHPSLNCYKRHGCRCVGCRRWNAFDVRRRAMLRAWT